ncbi:MAG: HAD-IIIC family phosphatase, partial [Gemmatimonadota bacterium]
MNKSVGLHDESATLERDLDAARSVEIPDAAICLKLARTYARMDQEEEAYAWLVRVVDAGDSFRSWSAAASLLSKLREEHVPASKRLVRVAVTGTYTTTQLSAMLRLAALRAGIDVGLYEGGFGQYRQDLLDPASAMYAFGVEYVVLATHDRALELPLFSDDPERHVAAEIGRWTSLWDALDQQSDARLIQHTFAIRPEAPFGHLSRSLPGSRYAMTAAVNVGIGEAAAGRVSIVDCERLASDFGKSRWFDDRYWHGAKQAVALDAVPMVARHTAAVLGACLGLSRKCLVLDLDNTLWGGVVGEDGLAGIELGAGVAGEAYVAFQRYLLELKERGVILAVVSKNNDADAREPFERHPDMAISLDDVAVFIANWEDKPTNIRHV